MNHEGDLQRNMWHPNCKIIDRLRLGGGNNERNQPHLHVGLRNGRLRPRSHGQRSACAKHGGPGGKTTYPVSLCSVGHIISPTTTMVSSSPLAVLRFRSGPSATRFPLGAGSAANPVLQCEWPP